MKLESDCYYQGKLSVDTYTDDFVCLVNNASYTDPITIVVKFRRGLDPAIQDKITKSGRDCPSDHDLAAWYAAAPLFDQNRMANTAFHTSTGRRPPISLHPPVARPSHSFMCSTPQSVMPTLTRSTTPIASMGVPMDIDAQRAQHATPKMCYRCGSTTHLPNCPQRFDVRHMTTDERDAYVQTVLTELDHTPEGSSDESATAVTDRGGLCSPQRAASTPPLSSAVHYACLVEDNTHNTTTCKPDQPKGVQPHPNPPRTGNFFSPGRDIVKCLRGGTGHLFSPCTKFKTCLRGGTGNFFSPRRSFKTCLRGGTKLFVPPRRDIVKCLRGGAGNFFSPRRTFKTCLRGGTGNFFSPRRSFKTCLRGGTGNFFSPCRSFKTCLRGGTKLFVPPRRDIVKGLRDGAGNFFFTSQSHHDAFAR